MRIYNLFPLLAGPIKDWKPHLDRAAALGFNWIFVNPIQQTGRSGSLYSIKDYFAINPALLDPASIQSAEEQMREIVRYAEDLGLSMMIDLVINHCAYDSPLLKEHPKWFVREGGQIAHPHCLHEGQQVVWEDLARFDFGTTDAEGLFKFCKKVIDYLGELGFRGFRCDAAYQIPQSMWSRLMEETRRARPDTLFAAETLGCSADQTRETARAGFDFIFNSSKWWDFSSPWLMEQYHLTRDTAPSISFPESHDTPRLFAESNGNIDMLKQRYLFAALFSAGVMMPMGYEYGFGKPLHVVATRPTDWENTSVDLTDYIRRVNQIKTNHAVFQEESLTEVLSHPNPGILVLWKATSRSGGEALLVLNKDPWNRQHFYTEDLYQYVQSPPPLTDVSPEWPMGYLPNPFEYDLPPGVGRVFVSG
ncbi:MAG: alpha-amylase [Gammaproteobacteria bacterium]|nr:alpha-amylase [Gammaproteobacteria bacterium]